MCNRPEMIKLVGDVFLHSPSLEKVAYLHFTYRLIFAECTYSFSTG